MTRQILGLDVGGANLKAATPDGRAASVPFALWKQPDGLPAALAALVGRFPEATELAVTMTGELCDCYETKRQGVGAILDAVEAVAAGRPVRVWGTGGEFLTADVARRGYLVVAAANWHATATFAGRLVADGLLIDIGSTTTDLTLIRAGTPAGCGLTDPARIETGELVYTGVRRTPVCVITPTPRLAAELFATSLDVYLTLGLLADDAADRDTADGRPATAAYAHGRLSRMLGGDPELTTVEQTRSLAMMFHRQQLNLLSILAEAIRSTPPTPRSDVFVLAGAGEFLGRQVAAACRGGRAKQVISLSARLGPAVSACAPAYAVAVLAAERPS